MVFSFIGHEQNGFIVEEYDKIVISMVVKCYHQLHPSTYNESSFVKDDIENYNLNIFDMNISTSELANKLVNKELLIFKKYQVDVKDIICPFQ